MPKKTWPKIRTRRSEVKGRRYTYWVVDCGMLNGSRKTHTYKTKKEAETKAEEVRREQSKIGKVALHLSDRQKQEAARAYALLNGSGTLVDAVEFYVKHTCPTGGQATINVLLEAFLQAKSSAGRREATLQNMKIRIGRFARKFGETPAHKITTHDIESWLDKNHITGTNRNNYRRALVGFFEFARKRKHIRGNPAEDLERPTLDEKLPEIFTVEETKRLLKAAQEHQPVMVPYFALCLFAGLRPAEAQNFDVSLIDFGSKLIPVRPEVAKKRRQRYIDLSDNLVQWLLPYRQMKATFTRYGLNIVRKKAKLSWAHDIMRHTYASYHLALHEDSAKTALQMGHMRPDVLFNHYRNLVRPADAKRFWAILPTAPCEVIPLSECADPV